MSDKLILAQFESNFIHWTKHWYEGSSHENFWPQIGAIYKEQYAMDSDCYEGIYHMVRDLWLKIANVLPEYNQELFLVNTKTIRCLLGQSFSGGRNILAILILNCHSITKT